MSDNNQTSADHTPVLVARKCHCGKWAGFGFSLTRREDQQEWWCWEHYPYKKLSDIPGRSH
ncbi:hypothetical protein [Rhizobium sp. GCM10022189]|uniref:hypothetical protein n=1 Tax=Rhizobium sp. GCM10022189 TaxID=3252654 RepID=UPI003615A39B